MFGGAHDEPIQISTVIDAGFGDLFRSQRIFYAIIRRLDVLPLPCLPGGSMGYFAYDGASLHLLSPTLQGVSDVLRPEGRPPVEYSSRRLVEFICTVAMRHRDATGHAPIASSEELRHFGSEIAWYVVDGRELDRVAKTIVPPTVTREPDGGWRVDFTTVYGWMHLTQELGLERLLASHNFELTRQPRTVLSKRIFAQTPSLVY